MADPFNDVSPKLNVIIALMLHVAAKDETFNEGKRKTGDLVAYLKRQGLSYHDIAAIVDSPIASVRELARLKGHARRRKK
jgi:hypothetical protein